MKCKPRFVIMIIACIAVMLVLGSCQAGVGNGTTDSSTVGAGSSDTVEGNSTVDITTVEETSSPESITTDAGTEAGTEAVTEAVTDKGTGAVITTGTNSVTSAETVPVTVPVTEQTTEAVTVPVTEPVTQPVTEATTEVVTSSVTEVTTEVATQPAKTTPADTTPAETTPVETQPMETQPAETTSAETTSPETQPVETQPEETVHVCVYTKELVAATCTKGGYTLNSCQCGNNYKDNITAAKGHKVNKWTESSAVLESALRCLYKVTYEGSCVNCKEIQIKSASEERHGWCVTVTSSATCVSAGVKGTFCTHMGCEYNTKAYSESEYNDSLAHEWVCEVSSGANLIYSCNYCAKKKTVIDCSEKTAAEIIKDAVLGTDEIVLREAAMSLSEELRAALPSSATLGAEKLTAEEISAATAAMSPADRVILGDAPVYSFSLTAAGENIDFAGGSVTIRLPYMLKTGENPDNVVVWYLADNGSVSAVDAVYSNGYVVFTLSHFSCYAVLELSGEEYCAEYGHAELNVTPASCTEGGRSVCPRCGAVVESTEALGHTWVSQVISELSETTNGVTRFTCSVCGVFYDNITVCEGHVHVLTLVPAAAAGCTKEGNIAYYVCSCGILFSDSDGQTEIDNLSLTVVPANGHSPEEIEALASTCVVKGHTAGAKCSVCGELLFGNEETDFAEHKYVGTVTSAGCVSDGYTTFVCSVCNDTYIDNIVGSSGHAYVDTVTPASCTTDGYTTHVCANCGDEYVDSIVGSSGHAYVDTVTPASCTTDGYTTHVCANCGDNYVDSIVGSSGHAYVDTVTPASCTTDGYTTHVCANCGDKYVDGFVGSSGHAYVDTVTPASCTTDGYTTHVCANCGDEFVDSIVGSSGHAYVDTVTPASCTTDGYTTHVCANCGDNYVDSLVGSSGHAYVDTVTPASCTTDGYTTHVCANCGDEYVDSIVGSSGHAYVDTVTPASCTTDGYTTHVCANCGDNYIDGFVGSSGHAYVDTIIPASCTSSGLLTTYCSKCQEVQNVQTLAALGHNYGEWSVVSSAICNVDGLKEKICSVCSDRATEIIPALSHNYVAVVTDPSCTRGGYTTHTCLNCQDVYTDSETEALEHEFEDSIIQLETYGFCGGTVSFHKCKTCNLFDSVAFDEGDCEHVRKQGTDTSEHTCAVCGHKVKIREYDITEDSCSTDAAFDLQLYDGNGVILLSETYHFYEEYHNYVLSSAIVIDETVGCASGAIYTYICTECDSEKTEILNGHKFIETTVLDNPEGCCLDGWSRYNKCETCGYIDPDYLVVSCKEHCSLEATVYDLCDYWFCGGTITVYNCTLCKCTADIVEQSECYCYEEFDWDWDGLPDTDEDGNKLLICYDCYCIRTELKNETASSACETVTDYYLKLTCDEFEELELSLNIHKSNHKYVESSAVLVDSTLGCEGGICFTYSCTECAYMYNTYSYTHRSEAESYALDEGSRTCDDGWTYTRYCEFCNAVLETRQGSGHVIICEKSEISENFCHSEVQTEKCCVCDEIFGVRVDSCCVMIEDYYDGCTYYWCPVCGGSCSIRELNALIDSCHIKKDSRYIFSSWGYDDIQVTGTEIIEIHKFVTDRIEFVGTESNCQKGVTEVLRCTSCGKIKTEEYYSHNYVLTPSYYDESQKCNSGWIAENVCSRCGQIEEGSQLEGAGHLTENYQTMSLEEYGLCYGSFMYNICKLCGEYSILNPYYEICCNKNAFWSEDGTEYTSCDVCGITCAVTCTDFRRGYCQSGCETKIVFTNSSGIEIVSFNAIEYDTYHKYDYYASTILNTEIGCEGGVRVTEKCRKCNALKTERVTEHKYVNSSSVLHGATDCVGGRLDSSVCKYCGQMEPGTSEKIIYDHHFVREAFDLSEYGLCGGKFIIESCTVCGETIEVRVYSYCNYTIVESDDERGYSLKRCQYCNSTLKQEYNIEYVSNCLSSNHEFCEILDSEGNVLFSAESDFQYGDHSFEMVSSVLINQELGCDYGIWNYYVCKECGFEKVTKTQSHSYKLNRFLQEDSVDCCDGWYCEYYCSRCGQRNENYKRGYGEGHVYGDNINIELTQFGVCNGAVSIANCRMCDDKFMFYSKSVCGEKIGEDDDGYSVYKCETCGTVRKEKRTSTKAGCDTCSTHNIIIVLSSGIEVLNETCETHSYVHKYKTISRSVDYPEYGCTFGVSEKLQCTACGHTRTGHSTEHGKYDYIYSLNETSVTCADGWTLNYQCVDCGAKDPNFKPQTGKGHKSYQAENFDLSEYGMCSGFATSDVCRFCGKITSIKTYYNCAYNYLGIDNDGYHTYSCDVCGFIRQIKNDEELIGCITYKTNRYRYLNPSNEVIYDKAYTEEKVTHDYVLTGVNIKNAELGCEAGADLYYGCTRCSAGYTGYTSSHEYASQYTAIDESKGCSAGFIYTYYCIYCGQKDPSRGTEVHDGHITASKQVFDFSSSGICRCILTESTCGSCGETSWLQMDDCCQHSKRTYLEDGTEVQQCTVCGSYRYQKDQSGVSGCYRYSTYYYKYTLADGTILYENTFTKYYYCHRLTASDFVFGDPAVGCTSGATKTYSCSICGYSFNSVVSTHTALYTKSVLPEGHVSCADGWVVATCCSRCDVTLSTGTDIRYEHRYMANTATAEDLTQYGACSGQIKFNTCYICGEEREVSLENISLCGVSPTEQPDGSYEWYDETCGMRLIRTIEEQMITDTKKKLILNLTLYNSEGTVVYHREIVLHQYVSS